MLSVASRLKTTILILPRAAAIDQTTAVESQRAGGGGRATKAAMPAVTYNVTGERSNQEQVWCVHIRGYKFFLSNVGSGYYGAPKNMPNYIRSVDRYSADIAVITLTHRHKRDRGHRTGSNNTLFFYFLRPIYHLRITLALPRSSNSNPESHSGPSPTPSPLRFVPSFLSREGYSIVFTHRLSNKLWTESITQATKKGSGVPTTYNN